MRSVTLLSAIAAALVVSAGAASASTIFNLDLENGGYSAKGTITTDGNQGTLATADIVDWNISLNTPTETFLLDGPAHSVMEVVNSGLSATAAGLFFDFSRADGSFVLFQYPTLGVGINYLCFDDATATCGGYASKASMFITASGSPFNLGSGNQQIASLAATPLPPALLLFTSALGGLGFVGWQRKTLQQFAMS